MSEEPEITPKIVIVDDEQMVLTSLESFLSLETDWEVVTFLSALEALEYAKDNDVHLVVSDYLMPDMDGISFLGQVRDLKPDVTRIILTGVRRQRERHQGDQRGWPVPVPRKALGQRRPASRLAQRPRQAEAAEHPARKNRRNQQSLFRPAGHSDGYSQSLRVNAPWMFRVRYR